jgi:IPT/TIG domain
LVITFFLLLKLITMNKYFISRYTWLAALILLLAVSCKKDAAVDSAPPVINTVTTLTDRSTAITTGELGQWVLIKGAHLAGTKLVAFNSITIEPADFYANDTSVTVKVPEKIAENVNNKITVTTVFGTVTFDFQVLQPAPFIYSFDPLGGAGGTVVNITGNWFQHLSSVKINDLDAQIVASTDTTIQVKLPAAATPGFFTVTTDGGTTKSANAFGFTYMIYEDALQTGWWEGSWSCTVDQANKEQVREGQDAIKIQYSAFGALQIGANLSTVGYSHIKVSLYGGAGADGNQVKLVLNGNSGSGVVLTLKGGKWTDYTVPLSSLGAPAVISTVWVQEFSNANSLVYIDAMGLF